MGVDHGLQGKEGIKSREKRTKKAQRTHKVVGKPGLVIGKKKELIFNDEARTEWLTGFHKRKVQRRQYGLTMGLLKEKKAKLDMRKQRRKLVAESETFIESQTEDNEDGDIPKTSTETCFDDDVTREMFGGDVSVVVDTGIADVLEDWAHPEGDPLDCEDSAQTRPTPQPPNKHKHKDKSKTRFEVATEKAKAKMRHRPGRTGGKNRLQRSAKTRLLHKALGSGALGANEYKGGKKHRRS